MLGIFRDPGVFTRFASRSLLPVSDAGQGVQCFKNRVIPWNGGFGRTCFADVFGLCGQHDNPVIADASGKIDLNSGYNVTVVVSWLLAEFGYTRKQTLDAIKCFQEKRNGDAGRRRTIAQRIDQGFGGVSDVLKAA